MNTKALKEAIEAIPGGQSNREKLGLFVASAISALGMIHLEEVRKVSPLPIVIGFKTETWTSIPMEKWEEGELSKALQEALNTYFELVQSSPFATDLFIDIHAELLACNDTNRKGQHMTPDGLAGIAMRFLSFEDARSVSDPTCGTGSLLLAAMRKIHKDQIQSNEHPFSEMTIWGNDLDPLLAGITAMQIYANRVLFGQPISELYVYAKDAITGKGEVVFVNGIVRWFFQFQDSLRKTGQLEDSLARFQRYGSNKEKDHA